MYPFSNEPFHRFTRTSVSSGTRSIRLRIVSPVIREDPILAPTMGKSQRGNVSICEMDTLCGPVYEHVCACMYMYVYVCICICVGVCEHVRGAPAGTVNSKIDTFRLSSKAMHVYVCTCMYMYVHSMYMRTRM